MFPPEGANDIPGFVDCNPHQPCTDMGFVFKFFLQNMILQEGVLHDIFCVFAVLTDTESSTLFEAVLRLPEKQRTVIHLFYYEDYTIKEIAEILHVSESNVKVRLNRGRAALREEIKEDWNYDES